MTTRLIPISAEDVEPIAKLWICDNCGDHAEVEPGGRCEVCEEGTIQIVPVLDARPFATRYEFGSIDEQLDEFDAWLCFRPDFAEVLIAYRKLRAAFKDSPDGEERGGMGDKHPSTWRERIRAAADAVDTAYAYRAKVFSDAIASGLTYRQVAEAAELSAPAVHKIVGNLRHPVNLDDPVPEDRSDA